MANVRPLEQTVEAIRAAALVFNKSLKIPARWRVAERISSSSRLMKINRAQHVLLLEDINEGRFKRKRGEFLCKARITNPSAHERLNVVDIDADKSKRVKVDCQKCLEIARKRWR
ncbi:hypothetical protein [Thermoactinomyces sp. CICC 10521]|uniref:hypothetical protein n=1 Tax=Thermoactinomyces sp. CICC 10521 TaxID=2767426 RepID=UPI0018DCE601|nr:hypothetical protein [Thermoactinomyces sp. CICC 10521]MBH8606019.1 hypothetical protein [Thermoactinomyces sp. CICC 10521]